MSDTDSTTYLLLDRIRDLEDTVGHQQDMVDRLVDAWQRSHMARGMFNRALMRRVTMSVCGIDQI